jgi:hypothetical protein
MVCRRRNWVRFVKPRQSDAFPAFHDAGRDEGDWGFYQNRVGRGAGINSNV